MKNRALITGGLLATALATMALGQQGPIQCVAEVTIVDENSQPVEGVKAVAGFAPGGAMGGASQPQEGMTDAEGKVKFTGQSIFPISIYATKDGYYRSHTELAIQQEKKVGVYVPVNNPQATVLLRKIKNPIPMFAKRIELISPENGKKIGYDLKAGDWVSPHGKGKTADMFILSELSQRDSRDFDHTIIITFPNEHDGIKEIFYDTPSEFNSDYLAPEQGYQSSWIYIRSRKPNEGEKGNVNRNRNYLLRVRTKADKTGKIESANYVKIYGEIPRFSYYFNPTANDRNLEFDPAKNLFKELPHDERVTDP
jgi:hypothetical protein